jgi:hypothetical protein
MRAELLQLAADLAERGEPFVLAVVVRREPYSSARWNGRHAPVAPSQLCWSAGG